MKKVLSFIIALAMAVLICAPSFAADTVTEKLYNVYGDGMLFQQNEEAVFAGTGKQGRRVEAILIDSTGRVAARGASVVGADGVFKTSFKAPAGGYEEYTVELRSNGYLFEKLENVVFGELWLSGGQSNMQIELRHSVTGRQMLADGTRGSKNVRYFYSAPNPVYKGSADNLPFEPQTEIEGCCWFDGTDDRIFNISGVGYFFAEKLQKELDMPVGLLSGSLGGSCIAAWIPRETVESDKNVKKAIGSAYISEKNWKEDGSLSVLSDCTGLYNKKIAPLTNFRPAGMVWYQGESDTGRDYGRYTTLFNALQDSYTRLFNHKNGDLPVVISALCDFSFGGLDGMKKMTAEFAEMQQLRPDSRAVVSVSDIPLTYYVETQTCHPAEKQPVGERMAYAAQGLVYGADNCVSAPSMKSSEIKDGSVYITFNYVGDTLKVKGDRICGFTICGKDGVYVPAEAEIVSKDTVRVYSDNVKKPKAAMYASGLITQRCNLFAYKNGEFVWPVLPTVTDWEYIDNIVTDFGWTDCDTSEIWRQESLTLAGYYDVWESDGAQVQVSPEAAYKGAGGLAVKGAADSFSVSPVTTYFDEENNKNIFQEFKQDWQNYKKMSVMVRNNGSEAVTLSNIKIYKENGKWVSPVLDGKLKTSAVIPADGEWHKLTFNLNTLMFSGKTTPAAASRTYLDNVADVEFCFEGANADLSMDEISFETTGIASPVIKLLGFDPVSLLFNLVTTIIGLIKMA